MSRRENHNDPLVRLSKSLSYVLRHGADKEGLAMRSDGFVEVAELLRSPRFRGHSLADIEHVVASSDKQRFSLMTDDGGRVWIKANQGHSLHVDDIDLQRVEDPAELPVVVHGTTMGAWQIIANCGYLSRMTRMHMHFAAGLPGASGVISGMRRSSDVLVYVDAAKAMADGIVFLRSPNNVILSDGVNGRLSLKYVDRVVTPSGRSLPFTVKELPTANDDNQATATNARPQQQQQQQQRPHQGHGKQRA